MLENIYRPHRELILQAHHNMEINELKIMNSRRRMNQSVLKAIIFQSACLIHLLCLVVSANLQQDLRDRKIIKREAEVTFLNGKQEDKLIEKDPNFRKIKKQIG